VTRPNKSTSGISGYKDFSSLLEKESGRAKKTRDTKRGKNWGRNNSKGQGSDYTSSIPPSRALKKLRGEEGASRLRWRIDLKQRGVHKEVGDAQSSAPRIRPSGDQALRGYAGRWCETRSRRCQGLADSRRSGEGRRRIRSREEPQLEKHAEEKRGGKHEPRTKGPNIHVEEGRASPQFGGEREYGRGTFPPKNLDLMGE